MLELPKVPDLPRALDEQVGLVRWGRFLAADTDEEREELAMQDPAIKEAKDTLDLLSADPAVQDLVQRRKEAQDLHQIALRAAEARGRAEGKAEGRAEGKAEGRADALRTAVTRLCEAFGIELDDQRRQELMGMSDAGLDALFGALTREQRWPSR